MNPQSVTRRELLAVSAMAGLAGIARPQAAWSAPPRANLKGDWYRQIVLAAGPVGYWRLGERTGATIAADHSPGRHDGAYFGQPGLGKPGALAGDRDTALVLDGQSYALKPPAALPKNASAG